MGYKDKEKQRAYQREWLAKRRKEFLDGKTCQKCGADDELQVDHVDPTTKVDHRMWSWTKARIVEELAKCQILCHSCHVTKSSQDGSRPSTDHGRCGMYESGCRCELCREWKRGVNAQRKARGWQ